MNGILRLRAVGKTHTKTVRTVFLAGALALSFAGLRMASGQEKAPSYALEEPGSGRAIVARVGPLRITAEEFRLSYEFGPAFAKRTHDAKHQYLGYMINEKLLALDALSQKRLLPRIAPTLTAIEGDLATEELFKEDVQSRVKVTDTEIAKGIAQSKRHIALQWIFTPDQAEIDRLAALIRSGLPFDSLYHQQGSDSALAVNRSVDATLFSIRMKNPDVALVADTLRPSHVSAPVHGDDGWYLLRVTDVTRDLLTTESDEMKLHNDVYRALLQQKSDSLSKLYVNTLMTEHQPVIVPETFDLVSSYLAARYLDTSHVREWGLTTPTAGEKDSSDAASIDLHAKKPLVKLARGATILLQEFLNWYRTRETLVKLSISTKQSYLFSLEQMIWQMVRDHLLVERAYKRDLHLRESVRTQRKWWQEKLLFEAEKRSIDESISFDEKTLHAFYEAGQRRYRDTHGVSLSFAEARDDVLRDYYEYELTKRLLHRLNALKMNYTIKVDEKILSRIPVQGDPAAINLYAVKKGGTFPRPAFPTIDMLWQTWN